MATVRSKTSIPNTQREVSTWNYEKALRNDRHPRCERLTPNPNPAVVKFCGLFRALLHLDLSMVRGIRYLCPNGMASTSGGHRRLKVRRRGQLISINCGVEGEGEGGEEGAEEVMGGKRERKREGSGKSRARIGRGKG